MCSITGIQFCYLDYMFIGTVCIGVQVEWNLKIFRDPWRRWANIQRQLLQGYISGMKQKHEKKAFGILFFYIVLFYMELLCTFSLGNKEEYGVFYLFFGIPWFFVLEFSWFSQTVTFLSFRKWVRLFWKTNMAAVKTLSNVFVPVLSIGHHFWHSCTHTHSVSLILQIF